MNRKNVLLYLLALAVAFLAGSGATLALRCIDAKEIRPIEGGRTLDFSNYGFTMAVPERFEVRDHTQQSLEAGSDVLYTGTMGDEADVLYLFCYENAAGDALREHAEQELVSHYMHAGATDVRLRTFGGRRFICYRVTTRAEDGTAQTWDSYETWNERVQIVFETRSAPSVVLPILATIDFSGE